MPHWDVATEETPVAEGPISARTVELWISYVLRVGVVLSGSVILIGVALYVGGRHSDAAPPSLSALLDSKSTPVHISDIVDRAAHLRPIGLIELGLLLLILTPVVRVAMTVMLFAIDWDPVFLVIVCVVLAILVVGITGYVG
jgi:uncharacterized membrane protein